MPLISLSVSLFSPVLLRLHAIHVSTCLYLPVGQSLAEGVLITSTNVWAVAATLESRS